MVFNLQFPSVQLACSTVNVPSPALQPATVSTYRRSAKKNAWMAAHVPVSLHPLSSYSPLCCSVAVINFACVCVSGGKVLDGNRCVEVSQCSCAHMGRHFPPGSTISQNCNTWYETMSTHRYVHKQTHSVQLFLFTLFVKCVPPWILGMYQ